MAPYCLKSFTTTAQTVLPRGLRVIPGVRVISKPCDQFNFQYCLSLQNRTCERWINLVLIWLLIIWLFFFQTLKNGDGLWWPTTIIVPKNYFKIAIVPIYSPEYYTKYSLYPTITSRSSRSSDSFLCSFLCLGEENMSSILFANRAYGLLLYFPWTPLFLAVL